MKKSATLLAILGIAAGAGAAVLGSAGDSQGAGFATSLCAWCVASNYNGLDGYPSTSYAPGQGYPAGWNPLIVLYPTRNLGHGVYFDEQGLLPVEAATRDEFMS